MVETRLLGENTVAKSIGIASAASLIGGVGFVIAAGKYELENADRLVGETHAKNFRVLWTQLQKELKGAPDVTISGGHHELDKFGLSLSSNSRYDPENPASKLKTLFTEGKLDIAKYEAEYAKLPHSKILQQMEANPVGNFLAKGVKLSSRGWTMAGLSVLGLMVAAFTAAVEEE